MAAATEGCRVGVRPGGRRLRHGADGARRGARPLRPAGRGGAGSGRGVEPARAVGLPPLLGLQAASIQAMVLGETGRTDQLRRLLAEVGPVVQAAQDRWGTATSPGIARLRTVEGELAHRDGDLAAAATLLRRAADLARTFGEPVAHVTALTALAEVELDGHDRPAARAALAEARDVVDNEPVAPLTVRRLEAVEHRAGRDGGPGRAPGRSPGRGADRPRAGDPASAGRRRHAAGDRGRAAPVDQHGQGLHEDPLPQARRREPAGRGAGGACTGADLNPTRVEPGGGGVGPPDSRRPWPGPRTRSSGGHRGRPRPNPARLHHLRHRRLRTRRGDARPAARPRRRRRRRAGEAPRLLPRLPRRHRPRLHAADPRRPRPASTAFDAVPQQQTTRIKRHDRRRDDARSATSPSCRASSTTSSMVPQWDFLSFLTAEAAALPGLRPAPGGRGDRPDRGGRRWSAVSLPHRRRASRRSARDLLPSPPTGGTPSSAARPG